MSERLTDEQKQIVEDSRWIVHKVLKDQDFRGNSEMYGACYLELCRCMLRYDATRGVKWDTYAYQTIRLYCKKLISIDQQYRKPLISDAKIADLPDDTDIETTCARNDWLNAFRSQLTDRQRQVFDLKLQGYGRNDIANKLGISQETIRLVWNKVIEKATADPALIANISPSKNKTPLP